MPTNDALEQATPFWTMATLGTYLLAKFVQVLDVFLLPKSLGTTLRYKMDHLKILTKLEKNLDESWE